MMHRPVNILVGSLLLLATPVAAQRPVLLTESAITSPKNSVDLFLGGEYLRKQETASQTLPLILIRAGVLGWHQGVSENVNLDLDWRGMLWDDRRTYRACVKALLPFVDLVIGNTSEWEALSKRERTVLQMLADGMANKEMAERLGVATKTVEHYRAALMEKLDLHDVARLTRYAVRMGLVTL